MWTLIFINRIISIGLNFHIGFAFESHRALSDSYLHHNIHHYSPFPSGALLATVDVRCSRPASAADNLALYLPDCCSS